jgi:hypothetical protein
MLYSIYFRMNIHISVKLKMIYWLVVSNMNFISMIYGMSSFPLTFIFFKMVKTTNQ